MPDKKLTNYDHIRNMSVEELARFLEAIQENALFNNKIMWKNEWKKVLEREVDTNG